MEPERSHWMRVLGRLAMLERNRRQFRAMSRQHPPRWSAYPAAPYLRNSEDSDPDPER